MPQPSSKKSYSYNKRSSSKKSWRLIAALALLVIVVVVAVLELTNTTHIFHKKHVPATIPLTAKTNSSAATKPSTAPQSGSNPSSGSAAPSTAQDSKNPSLTGASSSAGLTLVAPYGVFVSNHRPGQGSSPTTETSTCNTTPGATCYIAFTASGNTKATQLPSQVAGSDGSTSWTWDAKTLTSGTWQVKAISTLNGQTKSTADPTVLEIQ